MNEIISLWENNQDDLLKTVLMDQKNTFQIYKLEKLWSYFSFQPDRAISILQDVTSMNMIYILLRIYKNVLSDNHHSETFAFLQELDASYIYILGAPFLTRIVKIINTWPHDRDLYLDVVRYIIEEILSQEDMFSEKEKQNEKLFESIRPLLLFYIQKQPLDDQISFLAFFYEVHMGKPAVLPFMISLFKNDKRLREQMVTFVIRLESIDIEPELLKIMTNAEKKQIFETYRDRIVELLARKRKPMYVIRDLQKYRRLAQWSIRIYEPTPQQMDRRIQYQRLTVHRNIETVNTVLNALQQIDRNKEMVDPVRLRQLDSIVRKTVRDDPRLRSHLLVQIMKRFRKTK